MYEILNKDTTRSQGIKVDATSQGEQYQESQLVFIRHGDGFAAGSQFLRDELSQEVVID